MKSKRIKLQVNVPVSHVDAVRIALGNAGAGKIGEYSHCAFVSSGTGYFCGSSSSNPSIGSKGVLEAVAECKLEMVMNSEDLRVVMEALKISHPYEEIPVELFSLLDPQECLS